MDVKKVFSKRVMLELVNKGHIMLWAEDNHRYKWLKVFVFMNDDTFDKDFEIASNKK